MGLKFTGQDFFSGLRTYDLFDNHFRLGDFPRCKENQFLTTGGRQQLQYRKFLRRPDVHALNHSFSVSPMHAEPSGQVAYIQMVCRIRIHYFGESAKYLCGIGVHPVLTKGWFGYLK
jgi:hypothetical protein